MPSARRSDRLSVRRVMDGNLAGLVAVIMIFGIPMAPMYTFIHFSAYAKCAAKKGWQRSPGGDVPMQAELSEAARSPRSGICWWPRAIGCFVTFPERARRAPGHDCGHVGNRLFLSITLSSGGIEEHR